MKTENVNDDASQWGECVEAVVYELCLGSFGVLCTHAFPKQPKTELALLAITIATSARRSTKK